MNGRQKTIAAWAYERISTPETWCILDTETTDLDGEIVDIAIIAPDGQVLFESLIRPTGHIMEAARRVHGISDEEVAEAPTFAIVWPQIYDILSAKEQIVVYNAQFDRERITYSAECAGIALFTSFLAEEQAKRWKGGPAFALKAKWECAMKLYAEYVGLPGYRGGYKWHRLADACRQMQVEHSEWHRAKGDAIATLKLIQALAAKHEDEAPALEVVATPDIEG